MEFQYLTVHILAPVIGEGGETVLPFVSLKASDMPHEISFIHSTTLHLTLAYSRHQCKTQNGGKGRRGSTSQSLPRLSNLAWGTYLKMRVLGLIWRIV